MSQVKNGNTVEVHDTGKLDDGDVFYSSADPIPTPLFIPDHLQRYQNVDFFGENPHVV